MLRFASALLITLLPSVGSATVAPGFAGPSARTRILRAPSGRGGCQTYIAITAYPASPYYAATADITVEYGDVQTTPECLSYGGPTPSTFAFTVGGVDRTSYFSVGSSQAVGTGIPLSAGGNVFVASIQGNDVNGNPRTDTDSKTTTVSPTPAPYVSTAFNNYDAQDMGRCAVGCFAATYAFSTVPYFSLDAPRNVTLAYHGDRVAPRPFVYADVTIPSGSNTPLQFWLEVKRVSTGALLTFVNGETRLHFNASSQTVRLGGQLDTNGLGTGVYDIEVIVTSQFSGSAQATTVGTKLLVVNEASSSIARGWTIAGIQHAYVQADGSVLITEGDGSAVYFHWSGSLVTPIGDFSRLTVSGTGYGTVYTRAYPDSTKVTFDFSGQMRQIVDRFGNGTSVVYDGSARPWKIQDPTNAQFNPREIVLSYGPNGLQSIQDPFGRTTNVTVQANHTLTAIADPGGGTTAFGYDGSLRLSSVTDRRNATTTFAYDAQSGKLASVAAPAVAVFGEGTVSPVTTFAAWQSLGVPYGATSSTPFTPILPGNVKGAVTDPGGHPARFTVNRFGEALATTDTLGNVRTLTYTINGQLESVTDPLGISASFAHDNANGFMTSSTVAGFQTNFRNGGWSQADSTWGDGAGQRIFLGANGRVDSVRIGGRPGVPANQQSTYRYTYDSWGHPLTAVDPLGHLLARSWFDGTNSNRSKDSLPGGQVTTYAYDTYGRDTSVSQTGLPTRRTTYDLLNRPRQVFDGVNPNPTALGYDSLLLVSVTDPRGQVYQTGFNALGWMTSRTDPVSRSDTYEYDRDGELRRWTNRRGQNVDYAYDQLHRRTIKSGTNVVADTLSYTANGRVVTARSGVSVETVYLSDRQQPDSVKTVIAGQTYYRKYAYTAAGRQDSMWAFGGNFSFLNRRYVYSSAFGSLDSMRLGANWTRFSFNPDLNATVTRFPALDSVVRGFTERHGPDSIRSGSVMYDRYGYDSFARVQQVTDALSSPNKYRQFSYDSLGHLRQTTFGTAPTGCSWSIQTGWRCTGGGTDSTHTFSYDEVGNRLDHGGSYGTGNRVTAFNGCSYGTDFDGNVTSRSCPGQSVTFTWTADGQLSGFSIAGGATVAFQYEAFGRLARRDVNGSARSYFLWNGSDLLAELDASATGKVAEYNYYGTDAPHAMIRGGFAHHVHLDALGNAAALTNLNGKVTRTNQYDEWGHLVAATDTALGDSARARWKGALWMGPELELYYMRSRWYEPMTGRFLSEDPIQFQGGINFYAIAGDDPVNASDPLGLGECKKITLPDGTPAWECPPGVTAPIEVVAFPYVWSASPFWLGPAGADGSFGGSGSGRHAQPAARPEARGVGQCFSENTAPMRSLVGDALAASAALVWAGLSTRNTAAHRIYEGTMRIKLFFQQGNMASSLIEEGTSLAGEASTQMLVSGGELLALGTPLLVGTVGFTVSYGLTSLVICTANPNY